MGERIYDIRVKRRGRSDVVAGVIPAEGDDLRAVLQRLHPELDGEQLERELRHLVEYNCAHGNVIDVNTRLTCNHTVYLTSVRYRDAAGRIMRIEGATGRTTHFSYKDGGFAGFSILEIDGSLVDDLHLMPDGSWKSRGGARQANSVAIDKNGNISIEETDGNRTAHLTRGEEVLTRYSRDGKPLESLTLRHGKETVRYDYEYPDGIFTPKARFPGNLNAVELTEDETCAWIQRLRAAGVYNA